MQFVVVGVIQMCQNGHAMRMCVENRCWEAGYCEHCASLCPLSLSSCVQVFVTAMVQCDVDPHEKMMLQASRSLQTNNLTKTAFRYLLFLNHWRIRVFTSGVGVMYV